MNAAAPIDRKLSRNWAAELLSVDVEATPHEARCAFLQQLDSAHFSSLDSWYQAAGVLDESLAASAVARQAFEIELYAIQAEVIREAMGQFTSLFWESAPEERRARWRRLREESREFPALQARLQNMEPGLDWCIGPTSFHASAAPPAIRDRVQRLAVSILEAFPLAPGIRALHRRTFLMGIERDHRWQAAAIHLRKHHPAVAAFDEDLVRFLAAISERSRKATIEREAQNPPLSEATFLNYLWVIAIVGCLLIKLVVAQFSLEPTAESSTERETQPPKIPRSQPTPYKTPAKPDLSPIVVEAPKPTAWIGLSPSQRAALLSTLTIYYGRLFRVDGTPEILVSRQEPSEGLHAKQLWRLYGGKYRKSSDLPQAATTDPGSYLDETSKKFGLGIGLGILYPEYFTSDGNARTLEVGMKPKVRTPLEIWRHYGGVYEDERPSPTERRSPKTPQEKSR